MKVDLVRKTGSHPLLRPDHLVSIVMFSYLLACCFLLLALRRRPYPILKKLSYRHCKVTVACITKVRSIEIMH